MTKLSHQKTKSLPVVSIKGTPAWKGWLDKLAAHCRMSKSVLIDVALTEYACKINFKIKPPCRQQ
jgi:predicted transcriptional regulator